jgi:flagellar hook-associated protein 3 FlgL
MVYLTSTLSMSTFLRRSLMEAQTELARGQKELSTGRHADLGASLGLRVGHDWALGGARENIQAILLTNKLVDARLDATQTALSSIAADAQALRASLISAQNDGGAPEAIETQAKTALATFIATLNGSDGNSFIFAGINSDVAPIADYFANPPAANKTALDTAFMTAFGMTQSSAAVSTITPAQMQTFLSGAMAGLFSPAGWSADWSSAANQPLQSQISMSTTIDASVTANDPALQKLAMAYTTVSDLGMSKMNSSTYQTLLQAATQTVDQAISGLINMQAQVGVMQSNVSSATRTMWIQSAMLDYQISSLESVDSTEAATRVNGLMTQIETAYALTAKITQLSLTKYL